MYVRISDALLFVRTFTPVEQTRFSEVTEEYLAELLEESIPETTKKSN